MSNDVIRVDYEALAKIADRFGAEAGIVGEVDAIRDIDMPSLDLPEINFSF